MIPLLYVLLACRPSATPGTTGTDQTIVGDDDDTVSGDDDDVTGDDDDDTVTGDDADDTVTGDDDDDTVTGDDDDDTATDTSTMGSSGDSGCPGVYELCNGLDDDCDGSPHPDEVDADGDGVLDCAACEEAGFWAATRDLSGSALGTAVADAVQAQTCTDYSEAREYLFAQLDNDNGTIRCRYTGRTRGGVGANFNDWTDMNTEHTWPQSQGAGSEPAKCDLHHLFITDAVTNSQRGSHPMGEVVNDTTSISGGSRLGTNSSGQTVFEPRDDHKGDVARALTYFAHRYGYTLSASELALYQDWSNSDPIDAAELARTFEIAEEQVLANPFVTCPDLMSEL